MNILFLMTDQLRSDMVGWAHDSKLVTPNMDRIAAGTSFSCCQSVNPVCMPARSALLTGRYSHQVGALQMSGDLSQQIPTWPRALQKAGYWTAAVGKLHLMQTWRWQRGRGRGLNLVELSDQVKDYGFDHLWEVAGKQLAVANYCSYCEYLEGHGLLESFRDFVEARGRNFNHLTDELDKDGVPWPYAEEHHVDVVTASEIVRALEERPLDQPFAIFGSFCSPHKPFDPPQRFLDLVPYEEVDDFIPGPNPLTDSEKKVLWKLRHAYKATVLLVDEMVGKVLDALEKKGLLEETLVVLSSDHGEMMGDHGLVQKQQFYRQSQQVPLALRVPGYVDGRRVESPVELTDITATLLDAAGLDPQAELSNDWPAFNDRGCLPTRSLLPIVRGEDDQFREFAFSEYANSWSAITTTEGKYVQFHHYENPDEPRELFFDFTVDLSECVDLSPSAHASEKVAWYRRRLDWVRVTSPAAQTVWAPLMP